MRVAKAKATSAKDQFLEVVDHRQSDHRILDATRPREAERDPTTHEWRQPEGTKTIRRFFQPPRDKKATWNREREECEKRGEVYWRDSIIGSHVEDCPRWWCRDPPPDDSAQWADLLTAARVLEEAGKDLHVPEVQLAISGYDAVRSLGKERPRLEELNARLEVPFPSGSPEEYLRQRWLSELAPLLTKAREANPDPPSAGGPPADLPRRRFFDVAARYGWTVEVIAAVQLLTGIDKSKWAGLLSKTKKALKRYGRNPAKKP